MESPGEKFHAAERPAVAETRAVAPHLRPQWLHCQYDLTGFAVGQVCPECGMEIQQLEHHQAQPWTTRVALAIGLCSTGSMAIGLTLKRMASTTYTMATGDGLICLTVPLSILGLIAFGAAWGSLRRDHQEFEPSLALQAKIGLALSLLPIVFLGVVIALSFIL